MTCSVRKITRCDRSVSTGCGGVLTAVLGCSPGTRLLEREEIDVLVERTCDDVDELTDSIERVELVYAPNAFVAAANGSVGARRSTSHLHLN